MDTDMSMMVTEEQVEELEKIADKMLKNAQQSYKQVMGTLDQKLKKVQKLRDEDDDGKDSLNTYLTFIQETVRDIEDQDNQILKDHLDTHDYIMLECGGDATLNETIGFRNNYGIDQWEFDTGDICADFVARAWSRDPMLSCIFFFFMHAFVFNLFFFWFWACNTQKKNYFKSTNNE